MGSTPKLRTTDFVQTMAGVVGFAQSNMKYDGQPRGTVRATIQDVKDPENRGRVRVVFDEMNPAVPQRPGAQGFDGEREADAPSLSHWIDTSPAFRGRQPSGLVGKRVNVVVTNGQYQYAILQDTVYDPENLAESAAKKLKQPDNSTMVRLPVYASGELPPASAENVGCVVIESGGFDGMQWLSVCLQRSGGYTWVNLMDRLHIHDTQVNDSRGDREGRVNDDTHATS